MGRQSFYERPVGQVEIYGYDGREAWGGMGSTESGNQGKV